MYSVNGTSTAEKMCCLGPQDHRANVEELKEERPVALCSDTTESLSLLLFSVGVQGPKTLQQGRPPHLARAALLQSFVTELFL